jgi:cytochrome c biogenesis protein ResB
MKNFFLSLKTTVWTLLVLVCAFFIGSSMMPVHREIYAPMNDRLLFDWVSETASGNLWATWWFFAAFAGLILLTINTISCSIQAVKGRWSRTDFLLRISPQVVHIGFLFILLAHLMGAGWGYRLSGALPEGARTPLPENRVLYLRDVRIEMDRPGIMKGWAADVEVFERGEMVTAETLGPNKPLLYKGMGIYLKSFGFEPVPYALLMVNRDPGAVWALVGAVLFTIGSVTLLVLKWKKAEN